MAIHDWVQKVDLLLGSRKSLNQVALDEIVIHIYNQQFWLYVVADPQANDQLHVRLSATTSVSLTDIFLREQRQ